MIYTPAEDSYLLEQAVKKLVKGKSILDMGAGSGIISEAALKSGARAVLAVDIDKEAVEQLKGRGIPALQSYLFNNVLGEFDIIAFNAPYLPEDKREDRESRKATTGGKRGDEIILKFLSNVRAHLSLKGIILLVLSSLTPKKRILALLKKQKLKHKIITHKKLFMEKLELWVITYTI